ncbi:hypothetical protein [Clostridium tagluense]|uniref:Uncharacterized protein n=1 Tax=Clostridium tagluense TaxID=360422 RepID=A0A401URS6_9CLOT|nr:hypothetical protein [Clostridium tagluense]GCD12259.1 hypothetical protein Ctaglu_38820 [Clostridium tagluense]
MRKINTIESIKFDLENYVGQMYIATEGKTGYDSVIHPKMKDSGQKVFEYFKAKLFLFMHRMEA